MRRLIVLIGVLFLPSTIGQESYIAKKSDSEIYKPRTVFANEEFALDYKNMSSLKFIINLRNCSQCQGKERKKSRRERIRKRKDKGGKQPRQKNKTQKFPEDVDKRILRNNEKASLVRNRTIEILKSGFRILSGVTNESKNGSEWPPRVKETLLERILSSATSKQDVLVSATGYKVPLGFGIYEPKPPLSNHSVVHLSQKQLKQNNKKRNKSSGYDYEYDFLPNSQNARTNESALKRESFEAASDKTVEIMLKQIVSTLKNMTDCSNGSCGKTGSEDLCQKWLDCKQTLDRAFVGHNHTLPSCPCTYPSSIFYGEGIWDKKQKKYFRWRDASSELERLDVYKPGASYCIRSLLTQGSVALSSQQCCYDRNLQLLTRGSGAGTINFVSPEVSRKLHYTVDVVPWLLCKGDFTRYNQARSPDNGNDCPPNPNEQQYQLQVKLSKIY